MKKLTLVELKQYCKESGIKKYSTLNKEELVNYIAKHTKLTQKGGNHSQLTPEQLTQYEIYYKFLDFSIKCKLYSNKLNLYANTYIALVHIIKGKSSFQNIVLHNNGSGIYQMILLLNDISRGFFNLIELNRREEKKKLDQRFITMIQYNTFIDSIITYIKDIYKVAILTNNDLLKDDICKVYDYWAKSVCSSQLNKISRKFGKLSNKLFGWHTISDDTRKFMTISQQKVKNIYTSIETFKKNHLNNIYPYLINSEVELFKDLVSEINQKVTILQLQDKVQTINLNDYLTIEKTI
jgi:hypothetical protein